MKKILSILTISAFLLTAPMAFADDDNGSAIGIGGFYIDTLADPKPVGDLDHAHGLMNSGITGGVSGALAGSEGEAAGLIFNGMVEGELQSSATALTVTESARYNPGFGDKSTGVYSASKSIADTEGHLKVKVDPDGNGYFFCFPTAKGLVGGKISGFAAQGTLDASMLVDSPKYFDSKGFTGGIAAQGSIGAFEGFAAAESGPDYEETVYVGNWYSKRVGHGWNAHTMYKLFPPNAKPHGWNYCGPAYEKQMVDSKAGAGVGAGIFMEGNSYSQSYRFVDWNDGSKTEGMGTFVGADTTVESFGYDYNWDKGNGDAISGIRGGYIAVGGAATKTVQCLNGSKAKATAVGAYLGGGSLGSSFNGAVEGYSQTTITTYSGMKGSTVTAASGMQVTAAGSGIDMPQLDR